MIDDQDLYALADDGAGPPIRCRPAAEVMARGTRLRRRRQVLRSTGLTVAVVGLVGAGLLAVDRPSGPTDADVAAGNDPTVPSTEDVPSDPPPPRPECAESWRDAIAMPAVDAVAPEPLGPSEVPDELRYLPAWTPAGEAVTAAEGESWADTCPGGFPNPVDDALTLTTDGGDAVVDATITVTGPLAWPMFDAATEGPTEMAPVGSEESTYIRGREATFGGIDADFQFEWTEADGWTWGLRGIGVDEATIRAVGEALVLDSSPEGDEPAAALDDGAVPAGFEVVWQRPGVATPMSSAGTMWRVDVGDWTVMRGTRCQVQVSPRLGDAPVTSYTGVGSQLTTVDGQPAVLGSWLSYTVDQVAVLTWEISPGIVARAGCAHLGDGMPQALPMDSLVQFAESLEPVAPDDPRLPG